MLHHTKIVLSKYAVVEGRATRAEYWYFFLTCLILGFIVGFFGALSGLAESTINLIVTVIQVALLLPSITVGVRRLHDSNKSGWWLLVPLYNLYLLIRQGTVGPNRFGPDPRGVVTTETPSVTV